MTFSKLADTLGVSAGNLRSAFSRNKLSIKRPEDVQKFLAQRFSGQTSRRATRPQQSAKHLQKWHFVKK